MLFFLDTNVLIDLAAAKRTAPFFARALVENPNARTMTSALAVTEYFAGAGSEEEKFLTKWITRGELEIRFFDTLELARQSADLRRRHRLKLADAAILATALASDAHFLTGDLDLLRIAKRMLRASSPFPSSGGHA